jgi:hypothetical protein
LVFDGNLNKHLGNITNHTLRWNPQSGQFVERKRIFGTCLVETCVLDAHLKLTIGLRDDHRIGQPPGVVDLPYEASVEQLFDFFMDEVLLLNELLPGPLLDRSGIGVDL